MVEDNLPFLFVLQSPLLWSKVKSLLFFPNVSHEPCPSQMCYQISISPLIPTAIRPEPSLFFFFFFFPLKVNFLNRLSPGILSTPDVSLHLNVWPLLRQFNILKTKFTDLVNWRLIICTRKDFHGEFLQLRRKLLAERKDCKTAS